MAKLSKPASIATIIFALGVAWDNPAAAKGGGNSHSAATTAASQTGHSENMNAAKGKSYNSLGPRKSSGISAKRTNVKDAHDR
jgi:hypothetical protein